MIFLNVIRRFLSSLIICICLLAFASNVNASVEEAVLAGGCFWCLEHDLEELPGIISVESGYTGGLIEMPTYTNHKGHQEAVKVTYDPSKITFKELLRSYWKNIDPFDSSGQFCDKGDSYRPVIFYITESQEVDAKQSKRKVADQLSVSLDKIGVQIKSANVFWIAEEYHQDFAKKNAIKYNFYRSACRRDKRLKEVWDS